MPLLVAILRVAIAVGVVTTLFVLPFAYMVSPRSFDLMMTGGVSSAIGMLFGMRAPGGASARLGAAATFVIGIGAALVIGLVPGNGVGVIVPPLLALGCGFVWATRPAPITELADMLRLVFGTGLLAGIGLALPLAWLGLLGGLLPTSIFLPVTEIARTINRRRAGLPTSNLPLVLMALVALAGYVWAWQLVAAEANHLSPYLIAGLTAIYLFGLPGLLFFATLTVTRWFHLRLRFLAELAEYLRALYIPVGAFAIGYLLLTIVFAGIHGTIHHLDPSAFRLADPASTPGLGDWLFFSFFIATSQSTLDIVPQSGAAKACVGLELVLCLAWAVIGFAAVMAHIQPVLQRLAEARRSHDRSAAKP
ncbi:MAG: hypothetical protein NXI31_07165 [bacterium]|nr:hypothetical protein [bacterium]